jgi:cell division protein FtsW
MDDAFMSELPHERTGRAAQPGTLMVIAVALMSIGLVMVASATASLDRSLLESMRWGAPFGRQAIVMVIGIGAMLATMRLAVPLLRSQRIRRRLPQLVFLLTVLCLVAALIPGWTSEHRGSQRWFDLSAGGYAVSVQPSEFAKLALVAVLASFLAEGGADLRSFRRGFLPPAIAIGVCVLLVGKEDFGTAALFALLGGLMLLVAGCRFVHLLMIATLGAFGMAGLLFVAPYRLARIVAHLGLWDDPLGAGYQPVQSLTTIASGGWFGLGLGAGVQKYGYLPESHSDFIFSVICEETGIVGAGVVIALFCALVVLGLRTMWSARTRFERLLAFGITSVIGWQAVMNIAVVTVVTPTTGISLPLVSAGGSGLVTMCLAIGLLAAIALRARRDEAAVSDRSDPYGAIRFGVGRREVTA